MAFRRSCYKQDLAGPAPSLDAEKKVHKYLHTLDFVVHNIMQHNKNSLAV